MSTSDEARAMRWQPPKRPPLDLVNIEKEFLTQCGSCDYGLPYGCNCPTRDYRATMSDLVLAVENYRRLVRAIGERLSEERSPNVPKQPLTTLLRDFTELDATGQG